MAGHKMTPSGIDQLRWLMIARTADAGTTWVEDASRRWIGGVGHATAKHDPLLSQLPIQRRCC